MMVTNMQTEGGSRETARQIYSQVLNEAQDDETRNYATARLLGLDSLDERESINEALSTFKEKTGRCPASWREAFPLLRSVKSKSGKDLRFDSSTLAPFDPSDAPYLLVDKQKCESALDVQKTKAANLN